MDFDVKKQIFSIKPLKFKGKLFKEAYNKKMSIA
jgi:hypothetical protein